MKSSLMWFKKLNVFTYQGSKITPNNIKNSFIEKGIAGGRVIDFLHTVLPTLTHSST